jgi:hypothetical protein
MLGWLQSVAQRWQAEQQQYSCTSYSTAWLQDAAAAAALQDTTAEAAAAVAALTAAAEPLLSYG